MGPWRSNARIPFCGLQHPETTPPSQKSTTSQTAPAAALLYVNYWQTSPQLLPTAWAVTNEIVFYVLIGLGLSKTPGRTLLWFLVSLVYSVLAADYAPKNADLNYFLPSAASLPFALGALAYHASRSYS